MTEFDEASALGADYVPDGRHSFRERVDLDESRLNQGGAAAFNAYVNYDKELIPFHMIFFGRGKRQGAESDPNQYAEPGFAPVRGNIPMDMHPEPVRKAIEWSEHIIAERTADRFPLDGNPEEAVFRHHNEVVLNYWIHKELLQPNTKEKRSWYEYPARSRQWTSGHIWKYIGNPQVFGDHFLLVNEENFPGMLCRAETIIRQNESPTLHYIVQGTRANTYPTAMNFQIQGCLQLPDNITANQWAKIISQSMETWYLGKFGATPQGFPIQTSATVLEHTGCTNGSKCKFL